MLGYSVFSSLCAMLCYFTFVSILVLCCLFSFFFFFNDTATTEIYTLSLHDALPIELRTVRCSSVCGWNASQITGDCGSDRKSTRLNSSHMSKSYAVFCLKKKKKSCRHPRNHHRVTLMSHSYLLIRNLFRDCLCWSR